MALDRSYCLSRWLFFRVLGLCYFFAFISLAFQIDGLIGSQGIFPLGEFLKHASRVTGIDRYLAFPTLFWLDSSDGFILFLPTAGACLALLLTIGFFERAMTIVLWASYLTIATGCPLFLNYQWDALLLEVGFLAIFFAPGTMTPRVVTPRIPSAVLLFLYRFLLFRLMFSSGAVKLSSGDPTWSNLTALYYHYETQPLPTPLGYYLHQCPPWFQELSVGIVFFVELFVPFCMFAGIYGRRFAAVAFITLQVLIALTGNYAFFNILTIALSLLLFDDDFLIGLVPQGTANSLSYLIQTQEQERRWTHYPALCFAGIMIFLQCSLIAVQHVPVAIRQVVSYASNLSLVSSYGLFAVMTTKRPEIILEGSLDGKEWLDYEFPWKAGDVMRPPPWVAPHQPRIDWQLWFAALQDVRQNSWLLRLMQQLLKDSFPVVQLLAKNPFEAKPPKYIRAMLYEYHFTTLAEKQGTRAWWKRDLVGAYSPVFRLGPHGELDQVSLLAAKVRKQ